MINLISVFFGGALGAVVRYIFIKYTVLAGLNQILIINALGSFFIGLLFDLFKGLALPLFIEKLLFVGFLGSFTAFSSYALDIMKLVLDSKIKQPVIYIFLINFVAFIAVVGGMLIGRYLRLLISK